MRINGHAHIFTLQTVLSKEAIRIMANRLRGMGFRDFIVDAVTEVLAEQLLRPEYLTEDELLKRFVNAIVRSPQFKVLIPDLPFTITLAGDTTGLGGRALSALLDKLSSWIESRDGPGKSPYDVFQTLRIALQASIPQVASSLLAHLKPDDAIVALMMDIVAVNEPDRDRGNFEKQIVGTQQAALAFPGRVFPFIAVNPKRPDHYDIMVAAIEKRGFVGVKLYPSLGFEVGTPEMRKVVEYCIDRNLPITIHSTAGGFARDQAASDFAHPRHWENLLRDFSQLRICFAHCGGWGGLCGQVQEQIAWADQIIAYMGQFPNVYADLSYHVEMMIKGGAAEAAYLAALGALLQGPQAQRIIFGTDSWLLRLNIDDAQYWKYFETKLSPAQLDLVTRVAPTRFLGLPENGRPMATNVERYVRFLEQNADKVGAQPAEWLGQVSSANWKVVPASFGWSRTNHAHVTVYNQFRGQIPAKLRGKGFDDCAGVRLFQLDYFTFGGSPPPDLIVSGNARNLLSLCQKNGGIPETGFELSVIHARVIEILTEGRYTLAELGAAIDSMYLFKSEQP